MATDDLRYLAEQYLSGHTDIIAIAKKREAYTENLLRCGSTSTMGDAGDMRTDEVMQMWREFQRKK